MWHVMQPSLGAESRRCGDACGCVLAMAPTAQHAVRMIKRIGKIREDRDESVIRLEGHLNGADKGMQRLRGPQRARQAVARLQQRKSQHDEHVLVDEWPELRARTDVQANRRVLESRPFRL